ncbi:WXG100 family type VII secretion target [Corynebacterium cystitidis]
MLGRSSLGYSVASYAVIRGRGKQTATSSPVCYIVGRIDDWNAVGDRSCAVAQYAFRDSTAVDSAQGILRTQQEIRATLTAIDNDVRQLASQWEASESDQYQSLIARWQAAADEIRSLLSSVEGALTSFGAENAGMRTGITSRIDAVR